MRRSTWAARWCAKSLTLTGSSIHEKEGKRFCFRLRNGSQERIDVTLGASNDTKVEVKSGVEAGDEILLGDPDAAQEKKTETPPPAAPER